MNYITYSTKAEPKCCSCKEPITLTGMAMFRWHTHKNGADKPTVISVYVMHKGKCDKSIAMLNNHTDSTLELTDFTNSKDWFDTLHRLLKNYVWEEDQLNGLMNLCRWGQSL